MLPIRSAQALGPSSEAAAKHAGPPHELSGSGQKGNWGATKGVYTGVSTALAGVLAGCLALSC